MTSETGLKRLYRNNRTAQTVLDYFATRDRNREATHFERVLDVLMEGSSEPISRARLREVFRTLEKLGYGAFIVGRRGHATRFQHSLPLIELGQMAQIAAKPSRKNARRRVTARRTGRKIAA